MFECLHSTSPHLPVGVDTIHAHAIATKALEILPDVVLRANEKGNDVEVILHAP